MDKKQPPVAQLDRVSGYEPEGQEFESLQAGQFEKRWNEMLNSIEMRKNYMYPKGTFDSITMDDIKSFAHDQAEQEREAKERAERNECVCGTINCSTEYACHTSGY